MEAQRSFWDEENFSGETLVIVNRVLNMEAQVVALLATVRFLGTDIDLVELKAALQVPLDMILRAVTQLQEICGSD